MAKAKAAMAEFRTKKEAARRTRAVGKIATGKKSTAQQTKHNARYETPKKGKTVGKAPTSRGKGGQYAKKVDFHKQHESNYFDDHEWKADLASEDESIAFAGEFRVPALPKRKKLPIVKTSTPSSGRTTPSELESLDAATRKRRRRLVDGAWSLRRDGEVFSDDDEYDDDVERDGYPKRMRRRVGRDKFGDVWTYSRKRRRTTSRKKQSALSSAVYENDFKEEDLVASEPEQLDDPNMVYFTGLTRHPKLRYKPGERIAVPEELVYDEFVDLPGALEPVVDPLSIGGPVFGIDHQPSDPLPYSMGEVSSGKPGKREVGSTPATRTVALNSSPLKLASKEKQTLSGALTLKRFEKFFGDDEEEEEYEEGTSSSWSPFGLFNSMASWAGSWVKSTPEAQTHVSAANTAI